MTKEEILLKFKDINFMYNDSSKLDSLEHDLDNFEKEIYANIYINIIKAITDKVDTFTFENLVCEAVKDNDEYTWIEIY